MNLLFLVEGEQTEKLLYRAWVSHWFPSLVRVTNPAELAGSHYCVIGGGGQPHIFRRIHALLADVRDNPAIDHVFVCVDSEDATREETAAIIGRTLAEAERDTEARRGNPGFRTYAVVQHCCVETWLLGNRRLLRRNAQSEALRRFKAFHDVSTEDPEKMSHLPAWNRRAPFHLEYLREMFREQGLTYSKQRPGDALERHYMDALRARCAETGHLSSLGALFGVFERLC